MALPASGWITRVVRSGFRLLWSDSKPPRLRRPPPSRLLGDPSAQAALDREVLALQAKGAVESVFLSSSPGFYGRLFVVPKRTGGWRPVLDLSPLNVFLRKIRFRMETPASLRLALRPQDWAASIDLRDAYFQLTIHPRDRSWLRFVWRNQIFQFRALPFGLSLSPWIFTAVVKELVAAARRLGVRIRAYLDDWLVLASSSQQCRRDTGTVMGLASRLGFVVNFDKSELTPAQRFLYLGMEIDTVRWLVRPSEDRLRRLALKLQELRASGSASARSLAALLGHLESLVPLVPLAGVYKRPFQREFQNRWDQASSPWDTNIPLGAWFLQATEPWTDSAWLSRGVPIVLPTPVAEVFTDASLAGWGAHCGELSAQGGWSPDQAGWHINLLELMAVSRALETFLPSLPRGVIRVRSDNATVVAYINRQGGTVSRSLSRQTEDLLRWADSQGLSLVAVHIQGAANILADALSRSHEIVPSEWTLSFRILDRIWLRFFKPVVDLFASQFNRRLPVYVSPVPDGQAWAVDALSISWSGLEAYAFPPLPLLERVLRKADFEKPRLILVAPFWPRQTWFPDLLRLSKEDPLPLELGPRDLLQPRSGIPHGNPGVLHLHAWRL